MKIIKLKKEILHLKGKIRNDVDKPCVTCKSEAAYSEKYDSYYCPKCMHWLERICSDRTCCFCKDKPKYPQKEMQAKDRANFTED